MGWLAGLADGTATHHHLPPPPLRPPLLLSHSLRSHLSYCATARSIVSAIASLTTTRANHHADRATPPHPSPRRPPHSSSRSFSQSIISRSPDTALCNGLSCCSEAADLQLPTLAENGNPPAPPPKDVVAAAAAATPIMASPVPFLRPPVPGAGRSQSGSRMPKLGLAIPASPAQRPVNSAAAPAMANNTSVAKPALTIPTRQQPPKLSLATPMGTSHTPQENVQNKRRLPPLQMPGGGLSTSGGSSDDSARSRTNSFGTNNPAASSTSSTYSALNFADMLRDPESAAYSSSSTHSGVGMERENSMQGGAVDLEEHLKKLTLEKGEPLDVEDLDDLGWKAAKKEGRIVELGSLGEGAGGAVTRCVLKEGKTVFALKVGPDTLPEIPSC